MNNENRSNEETSRESSPALRATPKASTFQSGDGGAVQGGDNIHKKQATSHTRQDADRIKKIKTTESYKKKQNA